MRAHSYVLCRMVTQLVPCLLVFKGSFTHYAPENRENYPCYAVVLFRYPMLPFGRHRFGHLAALVEYHVDAGTSAIVAVGTTGEWSPERAGTYLLWLKDGGIRRTHSRHRGLRSNNTAHAIALSRRFATMGVVAGLSVTPITTNPPGRPLSSLLAIAEASGLPQILYNVPGHAPAVTSNPRRWPVWPRCRHHRF